VTVAITKETGARTGGAGSLVLRITASEPYPPTVYAQHGFLLEAGTEYRIKGWARADSFNQFEPAIWLSRADEGGADTLIAALGGTYSWQDFDETFTPAHDSYLRLGGSRGALPEEAIDFWFEYDDVTLWDTSEAFTSPLLYWTAGGDASLEKETTEVFEGLQSLAVVSSSSDFSRQDVNLDERYTNVVHAFVMFDNGNGTITSRVAYVGGGEA
jgi:hypothetical protein